MGFFIIFVALLVLNIGFFFLCKYKNNMYHDLKEKVGRDMNDLQNLDRSYTPIELERYKSLAAFVDKYWGKEHFYDNGKSVSKFFIVFSSTCIAVLLLIVLCIRNPLSIKNEKTENQETYKTLVTALENTDSIRIVDCDAIIEWNTDYIIRHRVNKNFFFNVFSPISVYEGTEYIELGDYYILED